MTPMPVVTPKPIRFSSPLAGALSGWRFGFQNFAFLLGVASLLLGGVWISVSLLIVIAIVIVGNAKFPYDLTEPENPPQGLLDVLARLGLPLMLANGLLLVHYFTAGDPLHLVAALRHFGVNLDAARAASSPFDKAVAIFSTGYQWGVAQSTAHELSHRLHSRRDRAIAQWMGALAFEPIFALHHPYCHHRLVGLPDDPGTARRGESLYAFMPRSFVGNATFAAQAEAARLKRLGLPFFSWRNRFLVAWLIPLFYVAVVLAIGGLPSLLAFLATALVARVILESVAYLQHYGLIRLPGERMDERLSWDVYLTVTCAMLYNVSRHSD
ncbi:MAG TPA: fatty acid desaturase, partial [Rhodoblastus sp.]|nr:fatty acid desaturase [Rhodoblastus sp.]